MRPSPRAIVTRLHTENVGVDIIATTPQEFAVAIKTDLDRWSKVVMQANIRMD